MQNYTGYSVLGFALIALGVLLSCRAADGRRAPQALAVRWHRMRIGQLCTIVLVLICGILACIKVWGGVVGPLLALSVWMLASVSVPGLLAWRRS